MKTLTLTALLMIIAVTTGCADMGGHGYYGNQYDSYGNYGSGSYNRYGTGYGTGYGYSPTYPYSNSYGNYGNGYYRYDNPNYSPYDKHRHDHDRDDWGRNDWRRDHSQHDRRDNDGWNGNNASHRLENKIEQRIENQQERIQQGVERGLINPREADKLMRQQERVERRIENITRDGYVTGTERRQLDRILDKSSSQIKQFNHNRRSNHRD